jgi:hypothetical protein
MSTLKPLYGSKVSLACTTTTLAADTNLLSGRQSAVESNATDLAVDALLGGQITTVAPTANTVVEIWLFASWDGGTTYTAGAGAGDGVLNLPTQGVKDLMQRVDVINQSDSTGRTYNVGPYSVANAFGGTMPDHYGFAVFHNTAVLIAAPSAPAPTTQTTGGNGTLAASTTYYVVITEVNPNGETTASANGSVTTGAGTTNQITVSLPALSGTGTGFNIYAGTTSSGPFYKQNTATQTSSFIFGTSSNPLQTSGTQPPNTNTTSSLGATAMAITPIQYQNI